MFMLGISAVKVCVFSNDTVHFCDFYEKQQIRLVTFAKKNVYLLFFVL